MKYAGLLLLALMLLRVQLSPRCWVSASLHSFGGGDASPSKLPRKIPVSLLPVPPQVVVLPLWLLSQVSHVFHSLS